MFRQEADASSYAGSMQGIRTEVFEDNMKSKTLPLYFECNHHSSTQVMQQKFVMNGKGFRY